MNSSIFQNSFVSGHELTACGKMLSRKSCHPERISDPAKRETKESTCPGVPWKDPENISATMLSGCSSAKKLRTRCPSQKAARFCRRFVTGHGFESCRAAFRQRTNATRNVYFLSAGASKKSMNFNYPFSIHVPNGGSVSAGTRNVSALFRLRICIFPQCLCGLFRLFRLEPRFSRIRIRARVLLFEPKHH
jgi:hypothetical protein